MSLGDAGYDERKGVGTTSASAVKVDRRAEKQKQPWQIVEERAEESAISNFVFALLTKVEGYHRSGYIPSTEV